MFICFELAFPPPVIRCSLWEIQKWENSLGCAALPAVDAEAGAGDRAELLPFLTQQNEGLSWWKEVEHMNTNISFFLKKSWVYFFLLMPAFSFAAGRKWREIQLLTN